MSNTISVEFRDYFNDQIESRYIEPSSKDRFNSTSVPFIFAKHKNNRYLGKGDRRVISPNLDYLREGHGEYVSFTALCNFANIDFHKIKSNIKKIKQTNNLELISIGYGGFSINVIHFMYELGKLVGETRWINHLRIYESDNISFSNSFRIYKDMSKISQITGHVVVHKFALMEENENIAQKVNLMHNRLNRPLQKNKNDFGTRRFYFGAPDFETRKAFENAPFIFTGHSGNEVEFYSKPIVDSDLTRETYGKIHLDYFFINILKSAEKLIDIFANQNPEDLKKDTLIWKYDSEKAGALK